VKSKCDFRKVEKVKCMSSKFFETKRGNLSLKKQISPLKTASLEVVAKAKNLSLELNYLMQRVEQEWNQR
jgi:hypothetical protein